jgi:hypothetical protein
VGQAYLTLIPVPHHQTGFTRAVEAAGAGGGPVIQCPPRPKAALGSLGG